MRRCLRDIEIVTAVRETSGPLLAKGRLAPLCRHRFHLIDGGPITGALNPETTLKPDWDVITYLHGAGRDHAEKWLDVARSAVGRLETVDLAELLLPARRGRRAVPHSRPAEAACAKARDGR